MPKRKNKYIDGIFNYCDRWCERCAFTDRCRSFAMEKMLRRQMERQERKGESAGKSWQDYDAVAEQIEPWLAAERDTFHEKLEEEDRRVRNEPLPRRAEDYLHAADAWFGEHLPQDPRDGSIADAAVADAAQVIRWYQYFILVKLMRALQTNDFELDVEDEDLDDGEDDPEIGEFIDQADRDDNNGTAKVALIAMDRSIAAWTVLGRAGLPETEPLVRQLDALRRVTEQVFPHAREFIRPGLDWPDMAEPEAS